MCPERACRLWLGAALTVAGLAACGPDVEDLIEQVARDPERREAARQELLLAKERAVTPLLEAVADPALRQGRGQLADALISMMVRVEDPRLPEALGQLLRHDEDAGVRARVARGFGLQRRAEGVDALVDGLADADGAVRYECLLALNALSDRLSAEQRQRADAAALALVHDDDEEMRMEARIRVDEAVGRWLAAAQNRELQAELAAAESLYTGALEFFPESKRANYRLARFHYDNGDTARGLARLRRHGMLLDVPRLARPPVIDGRLDDEVWARAARADTFFQLSHRHQAALVSALTTQLRVGYTPQALYVGFRGHDEHPEELMVRAQDHDDDVWWEDVIEIFLDADFDHLSYVQVGITSVPVVADNWYPGGFTPDDSARTWDADFEVATHVGADFWSVEYALRFQAPQLAPPAPGDVWGFNLSRTYRNTEYAQWVRTSGAHAPNEFGVLLFH